MALSLSQDNVGDEDVVGYGDGEMYGDGDEDVVGYGDGGKDSEKIFTRRAMCVGVMGRGCSSDDGDGLAILRRRPLSVPCPFAFPRRYLLLI